MFELKKKSPDFYQYNNRKTPQISTSIIIGRLVSYSYTSYLHYTLIYLRVIASLLFPKTPIIAQGENQGQ
jgi:hypothetical protein